MDDAMAHKRLSEVIDLIDQYADVYDRRWGHGGYAENPGYDTQLNAIEDQVRGQVRFARDVIAAMGEDRLVPRTEECPEVMQHWFKQARKAIVEAVAILTNREKLAEITGPVGPRLSASELHAAVWGAAAALWGDGHFQQAVKAGADALENKLQAIVGLGLSGADLAKAFALDAPTKECPRLRIRDIDPDPESKTWKSAHTGAGSLVRGAFMGVRNLVGHPGWPEPDDSEALEMLAVLSYVARFIDRCDVETAK